MITNYIPNTCKYNVNNLKKVVHIFSEASNKVYIDNGEAYVTGTVYDFQTISATSVSYNETTSYDDRFKFQKTVTVTVDGFVKLSALNEKYYVVLEDENGILWLVNQDFPSLVTYTYTLEDGKDDTVFTFNALSNFPTLKLNATIGNFNECKSYSLVKIENLKMLEKRYANIDASSSIIYGYSNQVYKTVKFNEGSLSLEEVFDGTNVNTSIQFSINMDDYQSSWHYNVLEYPYNKYVAVIDHLACGFEMGLVPSFNAQGSEIDGSNDTVTITLVGGSQKGSEWANSWTEVTVAPVYEWKLTDEWTCTPPPPPVEMKYSFTLNDSSTVSAECDDTSAVIFPEVSAYTSTITSVELGDCVDNIGNWAFSGCTSLTSFTMSDNVTVLGYLAFNSCPNLTSIEIPSGITEIQFGTFSNCYTLTSVTIPNAVTAIGDGAFGNCTGLTSITIPSGVTEIGGGCFDSCISLTSITVEATTPPALEDHVFTNTNNCPIYVPCESVDTYKNNTYWSEYSSRIQCIPIPKFTFILSDSSTITGECDSTSAITTNDTYTYISNIVSGSISSCVNAIGDYTFSGCTSLTDIVLPSSVTALGTYAFADCSSLTSIDLTYATWLNKAVFYGCTSLTSVTINTLSSVPESAFGNCSSLTSITIPNVASIGRAAYYGCSSLSSITIPASVTSMGNYAFYACSGLQSITINNATPPTVNFAPLESKTMYVFDGSSCPIYVPAASVDTYKTATYWKKYKTRYQAIPNS